MFRPHIRWLLTACGWLVILTLLVLFAGQALITQDTPKPADAIVVIGGDHKPERTRRAAQLYHDGYAPFIIVSAGTLVHEGDTWLPEAQVMLRQLLALNVPERVIILEQASQTTRQNAEYTLPILQQRRARSILLVTSPFHSRRAQKNFADVYVGEISISTQPAVADDFCAPCWFFQTDQRSVVLYEFWNWLGYIGRLRFDHL
jgi:uncharacterized SAM-binding protein YcdF (DUF218 family)